MAATADEDGGWLKQGQGYVEVTTRFPQCWDNCYTKLPAHDCEKTTFFEQIMTPQTNPNKPLLGYRPALPGNQWADQYSWISWGQAQATINHIGSGLAHLLSAVADVDGQQQPLQGSRVGIYSQNCPDWILAECGAFHQSMVPVPVYATCGVGTVETITRHSELRVIFVHVSLVHSLLEDLSKAIETNGPIVTRFIVAIGAESLADKPNPAIDITGPSSSPLPATSSSTSSTLTRPKWGCLETVKVMTMDALIALGKEHPHPACPPRPDDLYSIVYTSGSEGVPKGVMITHRNAASAVEMWYRWVEFVGCEDWVYFSYLPLAHVFEREISSLPIRCGGAIAFSSGNIASLLTEVEMAKPHFLIGVPRVWKRIYEKVNETIDHLPWHKWAVVKTAISCKMASVRNGYNTWVDWDGLVLHEISKHFGPNMKFVINGAAAVDPELALWLSSVFNIKFFVGYGMSETFAAVSCQHRGCDGIIGSIGCPVKGVTIRLVDVPEMNYLSTDSPPRGEIYIKGPIVSSGYYKNPEATAAAFNKDGEFVASGDIGRLNEDGSLSIIDRKKNLFKLAQGEYIALEYVETVYGRSPHIKQVWVWGDPFENFLLAVVVPDWTIAEAEMRAAVGPNAPADRVELCQCKQARDFILKQMELMASQAKLLSFQRVKAVLLEPSTWTIEKNQLTPTFKLRRAELQKTYADRLTAVSAEYKAHLLSKK